MTMMKTRTDLITRSVAGETVILDRLSGHVHTLNVTASCIWEVCDGAHSPSDMAAHVFSRFDGTPDDVLRDVLRTLDQFEQMGLVTR
jgi:Coenzyme PQQ synthesis protein D (PqqD)